MNTAEDALKRFVGDIGQQNFPGVSSPNMVNNRNALDVSQGLAASAGYVALLTKTVVCQRKTSSSALSKVGRTINL